MNSYDKPKPAAAPPPVTDVAATTWKRIMPWVVGLEILLSFPPLLLALSSKRYDGPLTFWSHPVSTRMRFLPFFTIIVCSVINAVCGLYKHVPDCISWSKVAILGAGFVCNSLYVAGERRLETLLPITMVVWLIFTRPLFSKRAQDYILPAVCLSLICLYACVSIFWVNLYVEVWVMHCIILLVCMIPTAIFIPLLICIGENRCEGLGSYVFFEGCMVLQMCLVALLQD